MRDPIRLKLEYLASTYNIDNLGLAWIEQKPDGSRVLVLCEVPDSVALLESIGGTMDQPAGKLTEADLERWLTELD